MNALTAKQEQEHIFWKYAFMLIGAAIVIIMPLLSSHYGQSGDEWLQMEYGQHIWDYFFNGDQQALDYTNKGLQYSHQEYYGGLFDFLTNVFHHWFPNTHILTIRHFCNAFLGSLLMLFTGLLAFRLSRKWSVGVVALLFIIFSPRIFGESMNNPKDIPFATGFIMGTYFLVAMLQEFPRKLLKNAAGLAIGWGIAFGIRSAGGILLGAYMVLFIAAYYFFNANFKQTIADNKARNKFLLYFIGAIAVGYIIGIATWPWGLQSPISHPLESLQGMTNREINIRFLFEGMNHISTDAPWYYEFKWIFISNPLILLAGTLLFAVLILQAKKRYGNFPVFLVVFGALFPILYMIYKHSTVYDTWRHVFFVYPFWVVGAALGWDTLNEYIKNEKLKWIPAAIALAGLLPVVAWSVKNHPNETVYFNQLAGGIEGANGYYDLDYYQNSGKQAADWIRKNAKPIPGRKTVVYSNMSGIWHYFSNDTGTITSDYKRYDARHDLAWDYYISYTRYISPYLLQNDLWPPKNAVYEVKVDGVTICAVYGRECADAHFDLAKQDFATAKQKFESCMAAGKTDADLYYGYAKALISEGKAPEALAALAQASKTDPDNLVYLDLQGKIYNAMQNPQGVNAITAQMQKILSRDAQYEAANN